MVAGLLATVVGAAVWPVIAWWFTGVPDAYTRTAAHLLGVTPPPAAKNGRNLTIR